MKRIVILGGGTGGTLLANRLRRAYRPEAAEIVVVDRDDAHVYQPGLLFVPFGRAEARRLSRPRWRQLRSGISYCQARIDHVDVEKDRVYLQNGNALDYDVLVVATGAQLLPDETDGLTGPGWQRNTTLRGSERTWRSGGRSLGKPRRTHRPSRSRMGHSSSSRTPT